MTTERQKKTIKSSVDSKASWFWNVVVTLPYSLPAALAAFSVVAMILLLAGELRNIFIWPIGLVAAIVTYVYATRITSRSFSKITTEYKVFGVLVILGVTLWALFNFNYNSQSIFIYRDPAVYTVASEWIANNPDLKIIQPDWYSEDQVSKKSAGYSLINEDPNRVYPQGQHMLAILVGLANRIVGSSKSLDTNILIGAIALLAMYGFVALFTKPRWAILATTTLAVSLPMIYFSRDIYTEPLTMLYIFGGMSLVILAIRSKAFLLWFIAGLTFGCAAMVRTDIFLPLFGLWFWLLIVLSCKNKEDFVATIKRMAVLGLGVAIPCVLGLLDLMHLASHTYHNTRKELLAIQSIVVVGLIITAGYIYILNKKRNYITRVYKKVHKKIPLLLTLLAVIIVLVMVARPLWNEQTETYRTQLIAGRQAIIIDKVPSGVEKPEVIADQLVWYLGPVTVLLGLLGMIILARRSVTHRKLEPLLGVVVVAVAALFYLNISTITPDHIWASRRILPIVIPGIVIFAAVALGMYFDKSKIYPKYKFFIAIILSILMVGGSLQASRYFLTSSNSEGELKMIEAVCDSVTLDDIVYWGGSLGYEAPQTTRAYCGVMSMRLASADKESLQNIYKISHEKGSVPLIGIYTSDLPHLDLNYNDFTEVYYLKNKYVEKTFKELPTRMVESERTLLLGEITEDGTVRPLSRL